MKRGQRAHLEVEAGEMAKNALVTQAQSAIHLVEEVLLTRSCCNGTRRESRVTALSQAHLLLPCRGHAGQGGGDIDVVTRSVLAPAQRALAVVLQIPTSNTPWAHRTCTSRSTLQHRSFPGFRRNPPSLSQESPSTRGEDRLSLRVGIRTCPRIANSEAYPPTQTFPSTRETRP